MNEIQHYRQIDIIRLIEKEIESTGKKLFNISQGKSLLQMAAEEPVNSDIRINVKLVGK